MYHVTLTRADNGALEFSPDTDDLNQAREWAGIFDLCPDYIVVEIVDEDGNVIE